MLPPPSKLTVLSLIVVPLLTTLPAAELSPIDLNKFPAADSLVPEVPIVRVATGRVIHRFFDTSPISPSGRWLAVLRMPAEDRTPRPGEAADVVVVDLATGEEKTVAQSRGWEIQMGANLQWGASDAELIFNDVDPADWSAFAVVLNPATGERRRLDGTVFMASADGAKLVSPNVLASRRAQTGYGVIVPEDFSPINVGPVDDDGIFVTDTASGKTRMVASIREIYERTVPSIAIEHPEQFHFYAFQAKWNPQGTRILTTLQWTPLEGGNRERGVITMNADGSDIRTAITPKQWSRGGHHVTWASDGEHLTMNLRTKDDPDSPLDIVKIGADGSNPEVIFTPGSGHPSMHPSLPIMVTDAYPGEPISGDDGTAPIRIMNLVTGQETVIARPLLAANEEGRKITEFRVDAHPAWDRTGRYVVFNGLHEGSRAVFLADVSRLIAREAAAAGQE